MVTAVSLTTMIVWGFGGLLMSQKSDSYLKDIVHELKLIRIEIQKQSKSNIKSTTTKEENKYI